MPNPFTKLPMNRSKQPGTVRAVQPQPEEYVGDNNPYRGVESHGVAPTVRPSSVPEYDEFTVVEPESPYYPPEPVPVRIVEESGSERRRMLAYHGYAAANTSPANMVCGTDIGRTQVNIKNTSATVVYLSHSISDCGPMSGYPLAQNEVFTSRTEEAIYAASSSSSAVELAIQAEYVSVIDA